MNGEKITGTQAQEKASAITLENKITTLEQELQFLRSQIQDQNQGQNQEAYPNRLSEKDLGTESGAVSEGALENETLDPLGEIASLPPAPIVNERTTQSLQNIKKEAYHESFILPEAQKEQIILDLKPEDHDATMVDLIEIIKKHGIINAVDIVAKLQSAHINDDFHRFLTEYIHKGYDPYTKVNDEMLRPFRRVLLEVLIPKKNNEHKTEQEHVHKMQSLLQGIQSFSQTHNEYITVEIANAVGAHDFAMYVSIHEDLVSIFEKQFLSLFPSGKLIVQKDDFNIFVENGNHAMYSATLKEVPAKPIKTIEDFHIDPVDIILGAFTKLDKETEGACLQFVIQPGSGFYSKNYAKALEKMRSGKNSEELYMRDTTADKVMYHTGKFIGAMGSVFGGGSSGKDETPKESTTNQSLMSGVEKKVAHTIFSTNIRLAISSENPARLGAIASEVKSAFDQFSNTQGNSFKWTAHEKDLKKATKDYIYRQFNASYDTPLNTLEIATLIHFPDEQKETTSQMKRLGMSAAAMPFSMNDAKGILLGTNEYAGSTQEVRMQEIDRLRHMYVIGQTGTGKTSLLKNMIVQDIKNGEGVCMIDPHGSDIQDILAAIPQERLDDVIYFDPSYIERPMGLNMLEYDERFPEQKTFVVNEMMSIFNKLFDMKTSGGPMFEQYFRNATMLVIDHPESGNTLLDVSRVLSDDKFREMKLSHCKNPTVVQFWKEIAGKAGGEASLANVVPYITSKFDVFLSNDIMRPVIAQKESSINFRKIMDEKKILLVNLSKGRLGDINSSLIGLIIVGKLLMAALSRVDSIGKDMSPFYLYIDEFQNVTTDSISAILSEARKYKLSLCIAHQFIAQLQPEIKDAVFGNVGTIATFRIGSEDAAFLENQFSPRFMQKDIMNIENYNFYLKMLSGGVPMDPINVRNIPPTQYDSSRIDDIKQLSYLKYGRSREEVEKIIMEGIQRK